MNWKCGILSFFIVLAGAVTVPFMGCDLNCPNNVDQTIEIVETYNPTNSIPQLSTNQVDRGNPNLNWFKDSSNYIWDGWKIK